MTSLRLNNIHTYLFNTYKVNCFNTCVAATRNFFVIIITNCVDQFRIINIQCDLLYMVQYDSVDFCRMHASSYIYMYDPDAFTETVSWSSAVCICGCKSIVYILTGL